MHPVKSANIRASVIVAVYNDHVALDLILLSFNQQTYKNFEVVVAEDGRDPAIQDIVQRAKTTYFYPIKHTTQDDLGIRKARSINNAILVSEGEVLVFIDGDCVPYTTFIEGHIALTTSRTVVTGRRTNLGPRYSDLLRQKRISALHLEKWFWMHYPFMCLDSKEGHVENGFYTPVGGPIYKIAKKLHRPNTSLLGCNFSCPRSAIMDINGFDESYGETPVSDDTDLQWRLRGIGMNFISAKNVANQFHLYHARSFRNKISNQEALELLKQNQSKNRFRCESGLDKH